MYGWIVTTVGLALVFSCPTVWAAGESADGETAYPTLRMASIQMAVTGDLDANLARIRRGIAEAATDGARVAVFPETALSGFERRTIEAMDWPRLAAAMQTVAETAREHGIYVVYGCATPSPFERPYNSAIVVGPDGREIHRYHKSFPESYFEPGDHLALFQIDGVPCTVIVCHDNRFPELVRVPVLAGARICFYISYEINEARRAEAKRESYRAQSIARAMENGIWWVQANGIGPVGAPALSLGNSVVVSPSGRVTAQAPELGDTMLMVDVDPAAANRGNPRQGLDGKALGNWWKEAVEMLKVRRRDE